MGRLLFIVLIGLGGLAILLSLGVWQVQRLAWKQDLLAGIDAEIGAPPEPMTGSALADAPRYKAVEISGAFDETHLRVLASRKSIGPVYRIVRPFVLEDGRRIIVDTGWIRDGVAVPDAPRSTLQLAGNLNDPNEIDRFTPDPDLGANLWFARDVDAMAVELKTDPIMVVLSKMPETDLGVTPWPIDSGNIPNDHLQYAITWFSLAVIWVGMTSYFLFRGRSARTMDKRT